ncbi:ribonuclease P protein component [Pseudenhygromyxa sp. WMMC2535]|uniref:ribonuclease P protein component n=1 Tax=Pseudenhygromyxa sp. WMMC2535 TaxID=2712867 RepID=UPI001553ADBD|nr:ribonuclease P protein component [Pseudenhygromyxa sp. WMMC2535]NVB37880.1 ribonuclease P protein component [Pseudenhygromyxa sp. WMMC2535]
MRPRGFPAQLRLKQRREFLRVQRGGRKIHVRHFIVFVKRRPAPRSPQATESGARARGSQVQGALLPTRCGITVTRKVGKAVVRNRIKRLVREVFRHERTRLPEGLDVVWVAKQQAAEVSLAGVSADFDQLRAALAQPAKRRSDSRSSGSSRGKVRGEGGGNEGGKKRGQRRSEGAGKARDRRHAGGRSERVVEPRPSERGDGE